MLRFDANKPDAAPRNYLARREQYRLFALVAALGLVVLLATQVSSERGRGVLALLFGDQVLGDQVATTIEPTGAEISELALAEPWLSPQQLATIQDNTVFRAEEADAWFSLFGQLKQLTAAPGPAAAVPVSYAQLARQPQAYRGRMVRMSGQVMRVEAQKPAENGLGIASYYRVIFRPRGAEVWPIAVYSLEAPAGVALGQSVSVPASAVGLFFKNQSYQSPAGAGIMPVILAQSVTLAAPAATSPAQEPSPMESGDLLLIAGIAAALSAVMVVFFVARGGGKISV